MMTVEPACRFCQGKLTDTTDYVRMAQVPAYTYSKYHCETCNSTEIFSKDGNPMVYWFLVGTYMLHFDPNPKLTLFSLRSCDGCAPGMSTFPFILEFNYLPNLTPQNTTEERIKILILFS